MTATPKKGEDHTPSPQATALHVVILELAIAGGIVLGKDLTPRWRLVVLAVVGLVVLIRLFPFKRRWGTPGETLEIDGAIIGLIVIPLFVLLGVDAGLALVGVHAVGPLAGFVIGFVVLCVAARVSLEPIWTGNRLPGPWLWSLGAAAHLTVLPIAAIALLGVINGDGEKLDQRQVVSSLNVVVLRSDDTSPPPVHQPNGWRVTTWTGRVEGDAIAWDGGRAPSLDGRADADRVLLLLPPAEDNADPDRWMRLADRVEPRATPTYALLRSPTTDQLGEWGRPLSGATGRAGRALPIDDLGGTGIDEAELGVRAAAEEPAAAADLALALAHRPILLFDGGEPVHRPLDVDQMLASKLVWMCKPGQKLRSGCEQITRGDQLQTGFNHLIFDTKGLADADLATRIYVHVTHVFPTSGKPEIDLDYWWYLPDNPAHSGSGAFCGPGFEIGGATCFDHQSDWEGVTVILDAAKPTSTPMAVNYAEHDGTVRYMWPALQRLWELTRANRLASVGDQTPRPLVFPARGTHASYPVACGKRSCPRSAVPGIKDTGALQDNPHDGQIPWPGNSDESCAGACVVLLPTRANGTEPARWNAWAGEWGTANCVLGGVLCSSAHPPASPSQQKRYRQPWCTKGLITFDTAARFKGPKPAPSCGEEPVAGGDLAHARKLLALGDSYSSGEGAGHYADGTDTSANSCHRSANAWPTLLAHKRGLVALPSPACSGALLSDVTDGRPAGEAERRLSQISRITGDPGVVTITMGGNDLGFSKVLEACIAGDCVHDYHRPSGDLLDATIDDLARRLPDAYRTIQAKAPAARVVVVDYPQLFPQRSAPNCAAAGRITPAEGDYLNEKIRRADIAILDAARAAGVTGVDVSNALKDGELSCSGTQYLNRASPQLEVLTASFHPNAAGQERLATAVATALADLDH
jgi:lysophospholipase L1-like esterase